MTLAFAGIALALVLYQCAKDGVWDRGWRWHRRQDDPSLFWTQIILELLAAVIFAALYAFKG